MQFFSRWHSYFWTLDYQQKSYFNFPPFPPGIILTLYASPGRVKPHTSKYVYLQPLESFDYNLRTPAPGLWLISRGGAALLILAVFLESQTGLRQIRKNYQDLSGVTGQLNPGRKTIVKPPLCSLWGPWRSLTCLFSCYPVRSCHQG